MDLDVSVTHEAQRTRVVVRGQPALGRLSSLLQVLEIDSTSWPRDAVLLDLSEMQSRFNEAERALLAEIAQRRFRSKRVELLWPSN